MQPSTTNTNHENIPYKLSVFLFGHEHDEPTSVTQFHKYTHEPNENRFNMDGDSDDDNHFILSGRSCLFCVCKCTLQKTYTFFVFIPYKCPPTRFVFISIHYSSFLSLKSVALHTYFIYKHPVKISSVLYSLVFA